MDYKKFSFLDYFLHFLSIISLIFLPPCLLILRRDKFHYLLLKTGKEAFWGGPGICFGNVGEIAL